MAIRSKVLVVFESASTLKELIAAAAGAFEMLPLRDRRQAVAFVKASPALAAVVVEHGGESRAAIEVLQNLQAAHPNLRRIVVADSGDALSIIDGLHTGAVDAIVYRPVDARQLAAAVYGGIVSTAAIPAATKQTQPTRRSASAR